MAKGPTRAELEEVVQEAVEALEDGNPIQAYKILSPYTEEVEDEDGED